jgi:hypothetical protein
MRSFTTTKQHCDSAGLGGHVSIRLKIHSTVTASPVQQASRTDAERTFARAVAGFQRHCYSRIRDL